MSKGEKRQKERNKIQILNKIPIKNKKKVVSK